MAYDNAYSSHSNDVAFMLRWGRRTRSFRVNQWVCVALLCLLPLLATWYLGASVYLIFHDELLASVMSRQTDMQYAYEDRISALKTQLDRQSSRGLIDRHTLETTIHDLTDRSAQLEARAVTIDKLVAESLLNPGGQRVARTRLPSSSWSDNPLLPQSAVTGAPPEVRAYAPATTPLPDAAGSDGLRLDHSTDSSALQQNQFVGRLSDDRPVEARTDAIASVFSRVEGRQAQTVARLRDPALRAIERMQTALADTGLPPSRWRDRSAIGPDVGGPFVPLDAGKSTFGQSVDVLRDAVAQYGRLSMIVDHVPLRKPLDGSLEVTSTFGARLDPFFGRPAMHTGMDLRENYGEPVEATAAGVVTIAGSEGGYGNMVEIDHGNGLATRYAHLSSIGVAVHQRIAAGDVVGRVGSTGRATGPHLHYETRINGEAVDPAKFLKAGAGLFPG